MEGKIVLFNSNERCMGIIGGLVCMLSLVACDKLTDSEEYVIDGGEMYLRTIKMFLVK